jgi:hypothetical protein
METCLPWRTFGVWLRSSPEPQEPREFKDVLEEFLTAQDQDAAKEFEVQGESPSPTIDVTFYWWRGASALLDMRSLPEFLWHSNPADKAPAPVKITAREIFEQLEKREVSYNCLELAGTNVKDKPS